MSTINNTPFLRTSRKFPQDTKLLEVELSKSYVDTANAVNSREICLYYTAIVNTGQQWSIPANGEVAQALRKVFLIPATAAGATATIIHNIPSISQVTRLYGTIISALPDFRPLPYASTTANANIELRADTTNIYVKVGSASPNIVSGNVIIEWLL